MTGQPPLVHAHVLDTWHLRYYWLVSKPQFHVGEGQQQALCCQGLHGIVSRYRLEGLPSVQLWVPHSGFLTYHLQYRCSGQHVEWVYHREEKADQFQPWVPHGGCNDHYRLAHFAEGETCVRFRVGNQPRVPRVDHPPNCVSGECVSEYRQDEGSHLVVGGQLACYPMLQLIYPKYCYFPISFLKGWGPDIVWH